MNCKCKPTTNPCIDPCASNYIQMPICPTPYGYHQHHQDYNHGGFGNYHKYFELITANHMLQLENTNLKMELCKCSEENKKLKEELEKAKQEIEKLKEELEKLKKELEDEKNKKTNCDSVEKLLKEEQEKSMELGKKLDALKTKVQNASQVTDLDGIKTEIENKAFDSPPRF